MNSATQERINRAAREIENLCYDDNYGSVLTAILERLAREQDWDTRHACAEAINAIGRDDPSIGVSARIILDAFKTTALQACMNARAI